MAAGAKRCSLHGISYPLNFNRCKVKGCDEDSLSYISNDSPDPDFQEQVDYYNNLIEDNEDDDEEIVLSLDSIIIGPRLIHPDLVHLGEAAISDVQQKPAHYKDQLWISHEDLIKAGYLNLEDFGVVMLMGRFYELQAHVGRSTLTHGIRGGVWWIEEINPDAFKCPDTYDYTPEGG